MPRGIERPNWKTLVDRRVAYVLEHKRAPHRADFAGVSFAHVDLTAVDFAGANLIGMDFTEACLNDVNFTGALLVSADFTRATLARATLTGASLTRANLTYAWLCYANFEGANLVGTCLDPKNAPNGGVGEWEEADDGYVYGYRTRDQMYRRGPDYEDGKHYEAPIFSTCPETACHPGLYVEPVLGKGRIQVRLKRADLHSVGGKHRCKAFDVIGLAQERRYNP